MQKIIPFLSLFIFYAANTHAQKACRGILTDSVSHKVIAFANIGIVGKGVGTVSNELGEYTLFYPDSLAEEKIKISMLGYKPKVFTVKQLASTAQIKLSPENTALEEVVVKAKKTKTKILGNNTVSPSVSAGFTRNNLGAEIAVKLNIKSKQTHLKKFMFNINTNSLGKIAFRFNIYNADKKGYPNENILKQTIFIEPAENTGLVTLDLTPYNIFVDDDVFVSIEWIKDYGDTKGLMFSAKLIGAATYFREASQDTWEKLGPIGVGLWAEVAY